MKFIAKIVSFFLLAVLTGCSTTGKVYLNEECARTFEVLEKKHSPLGAGVLETELRDVLGQNEEAFRVCRRRFLKAEKEGESSDEGSLALRIMIGADGKVIESCEIGSQFKSAELNQCVANGVKKLVFSRPKDGLPFTLTFRQEFRRDAF